MSYISKSLIISLLFIGTTFAMKQNVKTKKTLLKYKLMEFPALYIRYLAQKPPPIIIKKLENTKKFLFNEVCNNTRHMLTFNNKCFKNTQLIIEKFIQENSTKGISISTIRYINLMLLEAQQKAPLCMLDECLHDECSLTRKHHPIHRATFENLVLKKLRKQAETHNTIHYTSVASGYKFQDFLILCKFLKQHPHASLHVYCIDPVYETYTTINPSFKHTNKYDPIDNDDAVKNIYDYITQNSSSKSTLSTIFNYLTKEHNNHTFITFLQKQFPQANISLHLYTTIDSYTLALDRQEIPYPNMITLIDYPSQECRQSHIKLCQKVIQKNPNNVISNIMLRSLRDKYKNQLIIAKESVNKNGTAKTIYLYKYNTNTKIMVAKPLCIANHFKLCTDMVYFS